MRKKIVCLFMIIIVIALAIFAIFRMNKNDGDKNLRKVTVADATITSLTVAIA